MNSPTQEVKHRQWIKSYASKVASYCTLLNEKKHLLCGCYTYSHCTSSRHIGHVCKAKKARCFCTVGSRWCESPFDFCESTYSSMCGLMGCFPSKMYTAFKQGLPEWAIISHWLHSMFEDSDVKNMRRGVIYLERIEGCEIVFASVCYAFDGEAQRNSERRIGDRSPTKSATPHAALLHMDRKTTDSKTVQQNYWWNKFCVKI